MSDKPKEEIMTFMSSGEFERWLSKNHYKSRGIWLRMYKKNSGVDAIKGAQALDIALCYGWITGQARKGDDKFALWRFCPRRPRSIWSKINVGHAERLIKEGRMTPPGLMEIERAKLDGRWDRAYSSPKDAKLPEDFMKEVGKNRKAHAFLERLNKTNRYSLIFRIENATTPEKRAKKIKDLVKMLEEGRTYHQ